MTMKTITNNFWKKWITQNEKELLPLYMVKLRQKANMLQGERTAAADCWHEQNDLKNK